MKCNLILSKSVFCYELRRKSDIIKYYQALKETIVFKIVFKNEIRFNEYNFLDGFDITGVC